MKRLGFWALAAFGLVLIGGALWLWWDLDLRWRPHTIVKDQARIARLLDSSGWVSPHVGAGRLYMVAYRDCDACMRFQAEAFPKLQSVGVDTRVIVFARPDENGLIRSMPAERDTVAELWVNRDWRLYQRWTGTAPSSAWTAPGIAHSDGDAARTAVIDAGRTVVKSLRPLLAANGIPSGYPILIWWTNAGVMRGCACDGPKSFANVEKDLGA
jgi:hypothetical protein